MTKLWLPWIFLGTLLHYTYSGFGFLGLYNGLFILENLRAIYIAGVMKAQIEKVEGWSCHNQTTYWYLCSWFLPPCNTVDRYYRNKLIKTSNFHWRKLTPIFSKDLAKTSAPFFWLTKIIMGGSSLSFSNDSSFFLFSFSVTKYTLCSTRSVGLPVIMPWLLTCRLAIVWH